MQPKPVMALLALGFASVVAPLSALTSPPETLFRNIRVFDGPIWR